MPISNLWINEFPITINQSSGTNALVKLNMGTGIFPFANYNGSDIRVWDKTSDTQLRYYLSAWDYSAGLAELYFRSNNVLNQHSLYCGNPLASDESSFLSVFNSGAGFGSNGWGTLITGVNSASGNIYNFNYPTGISDPTIIQKWRIEENPILNIRQLYSEVAIPPVYSGVREITPLRNEYNRVCKFNNKYQWFFNIRPTGNMFTHQTYKGESTTLTGVISNFSLVYAPTGTARLASVGSALFENNTIYVFMTYGAKLGSSNITPLDVVVTTSADGINWTQHQFVTTTGVLRDATNGAPCDVVGVPWVIKCQDGKYMLVTESYSTTNAVPKWAIYGFTATSITGHYVPILNGSPLISGGFNGSWDSAGVANPKVIQFPNESYAIQYNGTSVGPQNIEDWNIGLATSLTRTGDYVKVNTNPHIGVIYSGPLSSYGVETSSLSYNESGDDYFCVVQVFQAASGYSSNTAEAYRAHPIRNQGGSLISRRVQDGAVAGMLLPTGTFRLTIRSNFLATRTQFANNFVFSILSTGSLPPINTSSLVANNRVLELSRRSFDETSIRGNILLSYYQPNGTRIFWKGSGIGWETSSTNANLEFGNSDILDTVVEDDGVNYTVKLYNNSNALIHNAIIQKTGVRSSINNNRYLLIGDPFTDVWLGGMYYHYIGQSEYTNIEYNGFVTYQQITSSSDGFDNDIYIIVNPPRGSTYVDRAGKFTINQNDSNADKSFGIFYKQNGRDFIK